MYGWTKRLNNSPMKSKGRFQNDKILNNKLKASLIYLQEIGRINYKFMAPSDKKNREKTHKKR